jgi:hypothetical protein
LAFTANLEVQLMGMEACSGAHFLGRALREQGHEVRLMPAQYVKPYVQTNKSDYLDAEAIAEAVQRPRMRFVPIKTEEQLDLQALHRVRERWVMRRTAVVNQIRSLLLERGLTVPKGRGHLEEQLPGILEDAELNLSGSFRVLLAQLLVRSDFQLARQLQHRCLPGVDYHSSFQQIAFFVEETGEYGELQLNHNGGEAGRFYRDLQQRGIRREWGWRLADIHAGSSDCWQR